MSIIMHRPIPDGFTPKTCTVVKKADGWYVCLSLEDATVPTLLPLDEVQNAIGIDVGLKEFLTTSDGEVEPIQQHYRRSQGKLARHQRHVEKGEKGSVNSLKRKNRIAKIHQRVQRQRQEFHYRVAHKLVQQYNLIAVEDLNIKGLARTKFAKSILDASWGKFITTLIAVAVKRGVRVVKVKPHGTTIDCSICGWKVPKNLSIRVHNCPGCKITLDRDHNAAINILKRGLCDVGLTLPACGGQLDWTIRGNGGLVQPNEAGKSDCEVRSLPHTARLG